MTTNKPPSTVGVADAADQPPQPINWSKASEKRRAEDKWGKPLISLGYCTVPSLLFQAQQRIPLSTEELALVMQLSDMWWEADKVPFPTKETLASRLKMGKRQVQRHLANLERKGLIERRTRFRGPREQAANGYALDGLVKRLMELEPEFRKEREVRRQRRRKLERAKE